MKSGTNMHVTRISERCETESADKMIYDIRAQLFKTLLNTAGAGMAQHAKLLLGWPASHIRVLVPVLAAQFLIQLSKNESGKTVGDSHPWVRQEWSS